MMRLVMEAVMVIAVVGILVFMVKVGGKGSNEDQLPLDSRDQDNQDDS